MRTHELKIERLTDESIAPFGEIISNPARTGRDPDFRGIGTDAWFSNFESRGRPLVATVHTHFAPLAFARLERHLSVTQTFVPIGGAASVVALAPPPADPDDLEAVADPGSVRAFLIDNTSYMLKMGTWHSLDRFPLHPPGSDFIIITDWDTQSELSARPRPEWRLTRDVDFEEARRVRFEIVL